MVLLQDKPTGNKILFSDSDDEDISVVKTTLTAEDSSESEDDKLKSTV